MNITLIEDKLHRLINILPQNVYQQLSTWVPMEKWTYHNLKAKIMDIINIAYRFQARDTVNQGKTNGLFNVENGRGGEVVKIMDVKRRNSGAMMLIHMRCTAQYVTEWRHELAPATECQ